MTNDNQYIVEYKAVLYPQILTARITAPSLAAAQEKAYNIITSKGFSKQEHEVLSVYPLTYLLDLDEKVDLIPVNPIQTFDNQHDAGTVLRMIEEMLLET